MRKSLPCANGSVSVAMHFDSVKTAPHSIAGNSNLAVTIGNNKTFAAVDTLPAYYPPHWQYVVLGKVDEADVVGELDTDGLRFGAPKFRLKAEYRAPVVVTVSWNAGGLQSRPMSAAKPCVRSFAPRRPNSGSW